MRWQKKGLGHNTVLLGVFCTWKLQYTKHTTTRDVRSTQPLLSIDSPPTIAGDMAGSPESRTGNGTSASARCH